MSGFKGFVKAAILMILLAVLAYTIFPKYKFMGPNNCVLYRCNVMTGEVLAWDYKNKAWVTPDSITLIFADMLNSD